MDVDEAKKLAELDREFRKSKTHAINFLLYLIPLGAGLFAAVLTFVLMSKVATSPGIEGGTTTALEYALIGIMQYTIPTAAFTGVFLAVYRFMTSEV